MRNWYFLSLLTCSILSAQADNLSKEPSYSVSLAEDEIRSLNALIISQQGKDPDQALQSIGSLRRLSEKGNNPEGLMQAYYQYGIYFNLKGKYDSLKFYAEKCIDLGLEKKLPKSRAFGYQLLGTYFWQTGSFDKATENHFRALRLRENLKDTSGIASSYLSVGGVFLYSNRLLKADEYLRKGLHLARQVKDDLLILRALHSRANLYGMREKYKGALAIDQEALKICEKTGSLRGYSEIYSNMALCYFFQGRLDQSLEYHYKVLSIDQFFKDDKQIGDTYLNIAQVYRKKKEYPKSAALLDKAIALFEGVDHKYGLKNAYHSLSETYAEQGDHKRAYHNFQKFHQVATELSNEANSKNIERLNVQYETEQKEQKIRVLSHQAKIQQLELNERNLLLLISVSLLTGGVILAYLFYRQRKLQEDAKLKEEINKQQQLAARAIISAEEQERHRIATELHDGVGQSLSATLVNLNILFSKLQLHGPEQRLAEASLSLLTEGYDELRTISHRMVPTYLLQKGFREALNDLLQKIDQSQLKIHLEVAGLDLPLKKDVENALFRIIQETIANVLKHAQATKLSIQLLADSEGIFLSLEDNGLGFDASELTGFKGVGLKSISSRVKLLKGAMEIDSRIGKGSFIAIHLPMQESVLSAENLQEPA